MRGRGPGGAARARAGAGGPPGSTTARAGPLGTWPPRAGSASRALRPLAPTNNAHVIQMYQIFVLSPYVERKGLTHGKEIYKTEYIII